MREGKPSSDRRQRTMRQAGLGAFLAMAVFASWSAAGFALSRCNSAGPTSVAARSPARPATRPEAQPPGNLTAVVDGGCEVDDRRVMLGETCRGARLTAVNAVLGSTEWHLGGNVYIILRLPDRPGSRVLVSAKPHD